MPTHKVLLIVVACCVVPFVLACGGCLFLLVMPSTVQLGGPTQIKGTTDLPDAPTADQEEQDKRLKLIATFRQNGVIHRFDNRYLYVNPPWNQLTIDDKLALAALVWAWGNNAKDIPTARNTKIGFRRLVIRDSRNATQLATYSPDAGLSFD